MAYRDHLITTMEQLQSLYGEKMGPRSSRRSTTSMTVIATDRDRAIRGASHLRTRGPGLLAQK